MKIRVSTCCNCKFAVSGRGDFHDKDEGGTFFYYCLHCLQACDTKLIEKTKKNKINMEIKKTEDRYIIKNINTIGGNPFYLKISKNELLELRNLIDKIFLDEKKPLKK